MTSETVQPACQHERPAPWQFGLPAAQLLRLGGARRKSRAESFSVSALLLGAIAWTFLEYVIHRWLGHDSRTRPNPFAAEHVRHHSEGNYFAPSWKKALSAVLFTAVGNLSLRSQPLPLA